MNGGNLDPALWRGLTQRRLGRRALLRGAGLLGAAAALGACGVQGTSKKQAATPDSLASFWSRQTKAGLLNFANWPLYIDVEKVNGKDTHPTLDQFTKQTGIKVNYKEVIEDNDSFLGKILPSLRAGQDTGWDLMVITNGPPLARLMRGNYLIPLDHAKLPNFAANAGSAFKNPSYDPGNRYTLAWQAGLTGIAYNPKLTKRPITSFNDLFDPAFKGRVGMFGDSLDLPNFAMVGLGINPEKSTPDDWRRTAAKLKEQRDQGLVRKYLDNSGEAEALSKGEVWLSMAYSGDIYQLQQSGSPDLRFVVPREGAVLWNDNMCIPAHAKHPLDALTYMDYVYRPEVAGKLAESINYITPVPAAKQQIEKDAAAASGDDKASLQALASSELIFPTQADFAKVHRYRELTPDEERTWDGIFQPIYQS